MTIFPFKEQQDKELIMASILIRISITRLDNQTKSCNRILEKCSPTGKPRMLENNDNYTSFYGMDANHVTLSIDLDFLRSPEKYKVLFYAKLNTFARSGKLKVTGLIKKKNQQNGKVETKTTEYSCHLG